MAHRPAHGDNLIFVVERVGENVVDNERRSADGAVAIGKMGFRAGIELRMEFPDSVKSEHGCLLASEYSLSFA